MANTTKQSNDSVIVTDEMTSIDVAQEQTRIKSIFDQRYKKLVELVQSETNIASRYELKLRIEEVQLMYQLLFKEGE